MTKPLHSLLFRPIDGIWMDTRENAGTLAGILASYDLVIDDRMQFGRFYDYDEGVCIYYRASAGKVSIEIWKIGE